MPSAHLACSGRARNGTMEKERVPKTSWALSVKPLRGVSVAARFRGETLAPLAALLRTAFYPTIVRVRVDAATCNLAGPHAALVSDP